MIPLILRELETARRQSPLRWQDLGDVAPYATLMRWRRRARQGRPLRQPPGPKKTGPVDWAELYREVASLPHGRRRTAGTAKLCRRLRRSVSRRQVRRLAAQIRKTKHDLMSRIHWLHPGLAWALDATHYGPDDTKLIPVQDLASRYRFVPLVAATENGRQIAAHLQGLFRRHGPPLFLKRDNGSPFNSEPVERLLARHRVLPLNSPPRYPPYNGAIEKGIGDLKRHLDKRLQPPLPFRPELAAQVEAAIHDLNHRPRRCLNHRTACDAFHDPGRRLRLSQKARGKIFRLLFAEFGSTIRNMRPRNHRELAACWRLTVEAWLRRQGLIAVRLNHQNQNVSTIFPKKWSHN